jgi:hypothetical protein
VYVKLLNPFLIEIERIDYDATAAAGNFDKVFKEPKLGTPGRLNKSLIKVKGQIAAKIKQEKQDQMASGNSPDSKMSIYFHYRDLEVAGLVDAATKKPNFNINDRLVAIYLMNGTLTDTFRDPPGLFATEVQSRAYAIGGVRNLVRVCFEERMVSAPKLLEEI